MDKSNKQESLDVNERVAEYRAMPLRCILAVEMGGKVALLDCGHRKSLFVSLHHGDNVRCPSCYRVGMIQAQKMLEV